MESRPYMYADDQTAETTSEDYATPREKREARAAQTTGRAPLGAKGRAEAQAARPQDHREPAPYRRDGDLVVPFRGAEIALSDVNVEDDYDLFVAIGELDDGKVSAFPRILSKVVRDDREVSKLREACSEDGYVSTQAMTEFLSLALETVLPKN